jgi:hypothetical protein
MNCRLTKTADGKNRHCCLKRHPNDYNMIRRYIIPYFMYLPWPPLEAGLSISTLCLLLKHARKLLWEHAVAQLVEALCYQPKGHGTNPVCVTGIFHWHNPSGRTMALRSTQPLTEMSTRNISWGWGGGVKAAGAYGWQPFYHHVPTVLKFGNFNHLEPSGPVQAWNGIV